MLQRYTLPATFASVPGRWARRGGGCAGLLALGLQPVDGIESGWRDSEGNTAWHYWGAAREAEPGVLEWLEAHVGGDREARNQAGLTCAHLLALNGRHADLTRWLERWPRPDDSQGAANESPRFRPFIKMAAWSGSRRSILRVLDGHDIVRADEACGDEGGLLTVALYRGRQEETLALLAGGADPNWRDGHGRTAMHHAALLGETELMVTLEDAGGDGELRDRGGQTAQDIFDDSPRRGDDYASALRAQWARRYSRLRRF